MNPFAAISAAPNTLPESAAEGDEQLPGLVTGEETTEGESFGNLLQQEQQPLTEETTIEAPTLDLSIVPQAEIPEKVVKLVSSDESVPSDLPDPPPPSPEAPLPVPHAQPRQDLPPKPETPSQPELQKAEAPAKESETVDNPPVLPRPAPPPLAGMPVAKQDETMPARTPTTKDIPAPAAVTKTVAERVDLKLETGHNETNQQDAATEFTITAFNEGEFFGEGSDEFRHAFNDEVEEVKNSAPVNRLRVAARETILFHALQLKDLGRTHLDVTFQPDNDTVITLHLQSINGEIVVEGRLDQGGNPELFAEWNRLQRSLSRDGVQLRNLDLNQHERRDAHHHRDERSPEQQPAFSREDRFASFSLAAADAAPFPGVVAVNDHASTWQAWG